MTVPLLDLTRQYKDIKKEVLDSLTLIFDQQKFVLGDEVSNFEKNFAHYNGAKYAVGCSSGTDALLMSLICANIGNGDEVITSPFTFFATIESILRVGAKPVFIDIDDKTFNIDCSKIEEKITSRTKAIMPVHIFGQCTNMTLVKEIAEKNNLTIIEDAAQAIGAEWNGKKAGSIGDFGCFSFFPSKNLGCFGDGGAVITNSKEHYEKLLMLRQHGLNPNKKYDHVYLGGNFRLDAIQAGVLNVKIKYIDAWNEKRRQNASFYNEKLKSIVSVPEESNECKHVYNQYTILVENRDELQKYLNNAGIQTAIYYPFSMSNRNAIPEDLRNNNLPICNKVCEHVLSLPIFPELEDDEKNQVINSIKDFIL